MNYVKLGNTGMDVSPICLGAMSFGTAEGCAHNAWALNEEDSRAIVKRALDLGVNFFDTANAYAYGNSEEILGRALNDYANRDEIVVATKVFVPMNQRPNGGGLSRKHIMSQIDQSLKRLGMDYVDLYIIHRWDYNTPIEETMEALHDIVKSGRARYIGASSMFAWQFAKAQHVAALNRWTRFVSMQPQVNLIYREEEREMIPQCTDMGVAVLPWSPLARGMLTRPPGAKTTRSETDLFSKYLYARTEENDRLVIEAVQAVAAEAGVPMARIALAWLLGKAGITAPIVGVTRTGQLDDALAALNLTLSAAQMERLEAPYVPHPVAGLAPPIAPGGTVSVGADR